MWNDIKIWNNPISKEGFHLNLLLLTIISFLYRTTLPVLQFPFLFLYLALLITVFYKKRIIINYIYDCIKAMWLPLVLLFILIISNFLSSKTYFLLFKDTINIIILFSFIYFAIYVINQKDKFSHFVYKFILFSIIFAVINLFVWTLDLGFLIRGSIDSNFKLIPSFIAFIGISYFYYRDRKTKYKIYSAIILIALSLFILYSGSRRGMFLFVIIQFVLFILWLLSFIKRNHKTEGLFSLVKYYFGFFIAVTLMVSLFFCYTSFETKNRMLEILSSKNTFITKRTISNKIYRYFRILNKDISREELENKLWSKEFDPVHPASGWGKRIHKIKYPLDGKNSQIVPEKAKGYLMDSTCNASSWDNNAYSYSKIFNSEVEENSKLIASVYCFVSEDFDGTWVKLRCEGDCHGNIESWYNLNNKGCWQKLSIDPVCRDGKVGLYLYFSKYGVTNFSSLKGYVIFAYPTYKILDEKDSVIYDASKGHSQLFLNKVFNHKQKEYSLSRASILNFHKKPILLSINNKIADSDPVRSLVKRLVIEDTVYYGYKADIDVEYDPKNPINGRTARWEFAWQIFKKEYNWRQKIFGNGFDYLNWYGYYFLKDKTKSDYPHNPFLSVLLYSGILGLLLYFILMFKVISIYLRYIKEYYILFIFFSITFFFSFFSANTPFSPPIMGFFVLLPFFIDYIHKKDKSS